MLASSKVMDALKGIGLNLYERRLWVALLARRTSTAGELSEIANVPRSRSYDILQSLAEKGFVIVQTGKPIKYVAVPPEESLDRAKRKLEEDVLSIQERIENLKQSPIMDELSILFERGMKIVSPQELTGAVKGKHSVGQQINSMIKGATKNINIVINEDSFEDFISSNMDLLKKANERGVDIRIATNISGKSLTNLKNISDIAKIRTFNKKEMPIGGKFIVVDGSETLLPLTDSQVHSTQDLAIWSKSSNVANGLLDPMFSLMWSQGKDIQKK